MRLKRAVVGFCAVLVGVLGCGGDKGGSASATEGASESNSSTTTSEPTGTGAPTEASGSMSATEGDDAGSMSASMSGTTDISGGMSASMSGSEDSGNESGGGTSSTGTTGMVSGGGETSLGTSTTGEPVNCNNFETEAECEAAGCMAFTGEELFDDGAGWCINAISFLGCTEQVACDDVILTACKGQTKYQFPNGCLPNGFMACEPPPDAGMDGYPDCN
jgi:hypothetical protein